MNEVSIVGVASRHGDDRVDFGGVPREVLVLKHRESEGNFRLENRQPRISSVGIGLLRSAKHVVASSQPGHEQGMRDSESPAPEGRYGSDGCSNDRDGDSGK